MALVLSRAGKRQNEATITALRALRKYKVDPMRRKQE